jgi:hypothetical protein
LDKRLVVKEEMIIASILDPRMKDTRLVDAYLEQNKITKLQILTSKLKEISTYRKDSVDISEATDPTVQVGKKIQVQTAELDLIKQYSQCSTENGVEDEILEYLRLKNIQEADILKWWKEHHRLFPTLAQLAKKYLCIPATSSKTEGCFSLMGMAIKARRATLSPTTVEMIMFIHENQFSMD